MSNRNLKLTWHLRELYVGNVKVGSISSWNDEYTAYVSGLDEKTFGELDEAMAWAEAQFVTPKNNVAQMLGAGWFMDRDEDGKMKAFHHCGVMVEENPANWYLAEVGGKACGHSDPKVAVKNLLNTLEAQAWEVRVAMVEFQWNEYTSQIKGAKGSYRATLVGVNTDLDVSVQMDGNQFQAYVKNLDLRIENYHLGMWCGSLDDAKKEAEAKAREWLLANKDKC